MKKLLSFLLIAVFCIPLAGCGLKSDVIAKINGEEVPLEFFNYFYYITSQSYGDNQDLAKEKAFERLKTYYIVKQLAIETGNDLTDEEKERVESNFTTIVNGYGGEEKLAEKLNESSKISTAGFKELMLLMKYSEVTQDKITAKYTEDEINKLDVKRIKHIQILTKDSTGGINFDNAQKAEAKVTAENVLSLANSGTDFDQLIADYSQDSLTNYEYFITPNGGYDQAIKDAVKKLEVGEISGIIEVKNDSYEAYEILKREPLESADFATFNAEIKTAKFYDELQVKMDKAKISMNKKAYAAVAKPSE